MEVNKILTHLYSPLMAIICLALLCGHTAHVSVVTIFHIALALAAFLALICRSPLPRLFYIVAAYCIVYTVWTLSAALPWDPPLDGKDTARFLMIPILILAPLRLMLIAPRKALKCFLFVSIAYLLFCLTIGAVEHFMGWHLPTSAAYGAGTVAPHLSTGLCYNPNDYSVLLVMSALYIFAYATHFTSRRWHLWGGTPLALCLPPLVWNQCYTGLVIVVLILLFYLSRRVRIRRKTAISLLIATAILATCFIAIKWDIIVPRLQIYIASITSLYDSYGIGFGPCGDRHYMAGLNNYDITYGLTNAHSYLLQLLLTSGLPVFLLYCLLIAYTMKSASRQGRDLFWIMPILYIMLLFSPASSLYLWGHYLFFDAFLCYAAYSDGTKIKDVTA